MQTGYSSRLSLFCHVSVPPLNGHNTLQGRYLPNSKWAPCNADEQALTEDAQRLKVNNVAGILQLFCSLAFCVQEQGMVLCTAYLPSTAGLDLSAEPQTRHIGHCCVQSKYVRPQQHYSMLQQDIMPGFM